MLAAYVSVVPPSNSIVAVADTCAGESSHGGVHVRQLTPTGC
jgi:hypothetical protein